MLCLQQSLILTKAEQSYFEFKMCGFEYFQVLGADSKQQDVFDAVGKRVTDGCLAGIAFAATSN